MLSCLCIFSFPCLLFKSTGTDPAWDRYGCKGHETLVGRIKKTPGYTWIPQSSSHIGQSERHYKLDDGHRIAKRKHNEEVDKNTHIWSKIIDCVKSQTVQNAPLDCMLSVIRDYFVEEVKNTDFIVIQANDATDICTHCQLVLVLHRRQQLCTRAFLRVHYHPERNCWHQRLWGGCARTVILNGQKNKLIGQSLWRGCYEGSHRRSAAQYIGCLDNAHYVYCYHNNHTHIYWII